MSPPGQPVRELEKERKRIANAYIWGAIFVLLGCLSLVLIFFLEEKALIFSAWNALYKLGIILFFVLLIVAGSWLRKAGYAEKGAIGEERVFECLKDLYAQLGWRYMLNLRVPDYHGDIDHLAISPSGKMFCIEIKNWKLDRYASDHNFTLDGLASNVKRQAVAVRKYTGSKYWVEGIVCFVESNALFNSNDWFAHKNTYFTYARHLPALLFQLGQDHAVRSNGQL